MNHPQVRVLMVTGGPGVVREAQKTSKRSILAGPGNPPAVVDESADLELAGREIVRGGYLAEYFSYANLPVNLAISPLVLFVGTLVIVTLSTSITFLTALSIAAIASPAWADAIDGKWCNGAKSFEINGPMITMPSGRLRTAPPSAAFMQGASSQWLHIPGRNRASTIG